MTEGPSVAVSLAGPSAIRQIVTTSVAVAVAVEMMIQVTLVAVETMTQVERHLTAVVDLVAPHQTQSPTRAVAVAVEEATMMMADGHRVADRQPVLVATQQTMTPQSVATRLTTHPQRASPGEHRMTSVMAAHHLIMTVSDATPRADRQPVREATQQMTTHSAQPSARRQSVRLSRSLDSRMTPRTSTSTRAVVKLKQASLAMQLKPNNGRIACSRVIQRQTHCQTSPSVTVMPR
jgi:hypothetical protein